MFRQPGCGSLRLICDPKGHNASKPSFKLCNPNGMPMMVIISAKPLRRYSMAIRSPPKITQIMFPIVFIPLDHYSRSTGGNHQHGAVGTNYCLTCHNTLDLRSSLLTLGRADASITLLSLNRSLVFADGVTFNLWGSWTSQASPSSPSGCVVVKKQLLWLKPVDWMINAKCPYVGRGL